MATRPSGATPVPALLAALNRGDTDFVIGTRYGEGVAIDASWPLHRRVISKGARLLGAALTPLRYRGRDERNQIAQLLTKP